MIWYCCPPCGTNPLIGAAVSAPVSAAGFANDKRPYADALPMPKLYAGDPLLVKVVKAITPLSASIVPLFAKVVIGVVPTAPLFRNVPALLQGCPAPQQCW